MNIISIPRTKYNIKEQDLCLGYARDFILAIQSNPYTSCISIYKTELGTEYIEVKLDVETPQYCSNDIRPTEYIGVEFYTGIEKYPIVYALRSDFPKVPHLNLSPKGYPKSLCIYEQPFEEQKYTWTTHKFLEDIRIWMKKTAKGELHQPDQLLEPFANYGGILVSPKSLDDKKEVSVVSYPRTNESSEVFFKITSSKKTNVGHTLIKARCNPILHGVINNSPVNLLDLFSFYSKLNINLVDRLKKAILDTDISSNSPLFYLEVPLKRDEDSATFQMNTLAFCANLSLNEIGEKLNVLARDDKNNYLPIILGNIVEENAKDIGVYPLKVIPEINNEDAAAFNNIPLFDKQISIIGVGSLGSHIVQNCAHSAFGRWHLFDYDRLLPHNVARHILPNYFVGYEKSPAVAKYINDILPLPDFCTPHVCKIQEIDTNEELAKTLNESNLVVDCSASLNVARFLTNVGISARLCSVFLNPSGTDLVILCEDGAKKHSLDTIEMQYYKYLINSIELDEHLKPINEIRYILSCRDKSSRIPLDLVSLHASIASKQIKELCKSDISFAAIWSSDEYGAIKYHPITTTETVEIFKNGWKVKADVDVIKRLHEFRLKSQPNETGGILLGSYDMVNNIIYVVDFLPSPKDSKELATNYYRGVEGVEAYLEKVDKVTAGNVHYIGEWHSHPKDVSLNPSVDDKNLFKWIGDDALKPNGYPPLMVIVGCEKINYLVDKI